MKRHINQSERERLANEHRSWMVMIVEQSVLGMIIGTLVAGLIMQFDVNRIGTMIANSSDRFAFTALFMIGFAITFGMVAAGLAIWWRAVMTEED